jgi:hypothetical protein
VRPALILAFLLIATPLPAETIDGIAATVDDSVITISDLDRLVALELVERLPAETNDTYRRRMLQHLIARILQRRDIRRFADIQVDEKSVDLQMERLVARHGSKEEFEQLLHRVGITLPAVRELVASEIEVRTYINERFAPLLFVPLEDIERYYQDSWSQQRREDGLTVPPLSEVRESLRDVLRAEQLSAEVDKWTRQLRSRANVDVFVFR